VACSSNASTPPAPASAVRPPIGDPIAAYRHYWLITTASGQNPSARDWSADISLVTADPLRTSDIDSWRHFRDLGVVQTGEPQLSPRLDSEQADLAQISDCINDSTVQTVQNGRQLAHPPGYPAKHQAAATLRLIDGEWRLTQLDQHWKTGC
jgi:hypothetical protein